ncbi:MAG: hypothetical protein EBX41_00885 [Chitinophagia bacterium]|nr:hypothetical protein [Chitinophagia bacterium]
MKKVKIRLDVFNPTFDKSAFIGKLLSVFPSYQLDLIAYPSKIIHGLFNQIEIGIEGTGSFSLGTLQSLCDKNFKNIVIDVRIVSFCNVRILPFPYEPNDPLRIALLTNYRWDWGCVAEDVRFIAGSIPLPYTRYNIVKDYSWLTIIEFNVEDGVEYELHYGWLCAAMIAYNRRRETPVIADIYIHDC